MIKYVEFTRYDEYGEHITPIKSLRSLEKTASARKYSSAIMAYVDALQKRDDKYYVVMNAVGSFEYWGMNSNGDIFPDESLSHMSLPSDANGPEDYGFKTFEYYAKFYKHHVNKDPKNSFGEVLFAHWNSETHRVELVVAIDIFKSKDTVEKLDKGDDIGVSMGCFTDPNYPILTNKGYIPISSIKVGDVVLTHKGNWKPVTELHSRKYTGLVRNLKLRGLSIETEVTADHPFVAKIFSADSNNKERPYINESDFNAVTFDWAHTAHFEKGDHIQYIPVNYNKSEYTAIGDINLARLMGYYLAEGSCGYNNSKPSTVQLNCHINDEIVRIAPKIVNSIFPGVTCNLYPRSNSKYGVSVNIHSTQIACFMAEYIGTGCMSKVIPPEIFVADRDVKLAFLGAWLSGDGFTDAKGIHWSTANISLALQGRDLLALCGIPSSIYKITHKAGIGFNFHDTVEYTLNISKYDAGDLVQYSEMKLAKLCDIVEPRVKKQSSMKFSGDTISYTISDIQDRYVEDTVVYNFEVEGDESYSAAGLASHNCKVKYDVCNICGNQRSKQGEECKHIKHHLREVIDADTANQWSRELGKKIIPGMQVGMINEKPRFFDISEVYVPADRIAHILGKVAGASKALLSTSLAEVIGVTDADIDKVAGMLKNSALTKEINSQGNTETQPDGIMYSPERIRAIKENIDKKVLEQINSEPDIEDGVIDDMTESFGAIPLVSTLFHASVPIRPREFQRIILIGSGNKGVADALSARGIDFENSGLCDQCGGQSDFPLEDPDDAILPFIKHIIRMRSSHPCMVTSNEREKLIMTKKASLNTGEKIMSQSDIAVAKSVSPLLMGIAALYMGLRATASNRSIKDIVLSGMSSRGMQSLLGGAVLANIMNSDKSSVYNDIIMTPAKHYENTLSPTLFSGHMVKSAAINLSPDMKAGLKGAAVISGITLPLAHLISSYNRSHIINKGKPAGVLAHAVDPIGTPLSAGVLGGAAIALLSKLKKK